jgi:predicted DNA-binding protein
MTNQKLYAVRGPRFTANQRETLDAIEHALNRRQIDFFTAVELSDRVKAGQVDVVVEALEHLTGKPVKLTDLLDYDDEPN